jgi:hypothetical protein
MGILTVLLTAAIGGVRAHQVSVAKQWRRLEAAQAASSRLEVLRDETAAVAPGVTSFAPSMAGARGTQVVRVVEPGLLEVTVRVRHPDEDVEVRLATRIAREASP